MNRLLLITFVIFSSFFVLMFAQKSGMGRKSSGINCIRMYDVKTVQTFPGEVIKVEKFIPSKGMSYGIHLIVKTNSETLSVHLGPAWFMNKQKIKIKLKDRITITGSRITYQGSKVIIASKVIKNNETLILRDPNGSPVWSRSGNR